MDSELRQKLEALEYVDGFLGYDDKEFKAVQKFAKYVLDLTARSNDGTPAQKED